MQSHDLYATATSGDVSVSVEHSSRGRGVIGIVLPDFNCKFRQQSMGTIIEMAEFLNRPTNAAGEDRIRIGTLDAGIVWLKRGVDMTNQVYLVVQGKSGTMEVAFPEQRFVDLRNTLGILIEDNDEIDNGHSNLDAQTASRKSRIRFGLGTLFLVFMLVTIVIGNRSNKWYRDYRRVQSVASTLEDYRRMLITYNLDFHSIFPNNAIHSYDETKMDRFPTTESWPDVLGDVFKRPGEFEEFHSGQSGAIGEAAYFDEPLDSIVAANGKSTLILNKGTKRGAKVAQHRYSSLISKGEFDGEAFFDSYATAYFQGDLNGVVESESYYAMLIEGNMAGHFETGSYAMIYLLGGFEGTMKLGRSKVYIAGLTLEADLERISGEGEVCLEKSDFTGTKVVGNLTFQVVGRKHHAKEEQDLSNSRE